MLDRPNSRTSCPRTINSVLRDSASIQRGIIRHVYLVIDLSSAMLVRDYKATWLDLTLQYAQVRPSVSLFSGVETPADVLGKTQEFVTEFFDQNPIGQMAIMVTRDGLAERLTPLSGAVFLSPSPLSRPAKD
jgi:transcription initiation factor TFIIH subunit 2